MKAGKIYDVEGRSLIWSLSQIRPATLERM
jgi:hypothetical protein